MTIKCCCTNCVNDRDSRLARSLLHLQPKRSNLTRCKYNFALTSTQGNYRRFSLRTLRPRALKNSENEIAPLKHVSTVHEVHILNFAMVLLLKVWASNLCVTSLSHANAVQSRVRSFWNASNAHSPRLLLTSCGMFLPRDKTKETKLKHVESEGFVNTTPRRSTNGCQKSSLRNGGIILACTWFSTTNSVRLSPLYMDL